MSQGPDILLLDACVLINLFACGHADEILGLLDFSPAIVSHVYRETLYIRRGGSGGDARESVTIDLTDLLAHGLLHVVADASDVELNTFVDFTLELGDGEAMTAALAVHRGHVVATDDRVALRVVGSRVPTLSSLDLIKLWAEQKRVAPLTITAALRDLRQRGSYLPGARHPLKRWWDRYYEGT